MNRNREDAALVGRGPDPAGTGGGRSSPLPPRWPQELLLDGQRRAGGTAFTTCSWHFGCPHRAEPQTHNTTVHNSTVVKLSVLCWGQVGQLVKSRCGFVFRNELTLAGNT